YDDIRGTLTPISIHHILPTTSSEANEDIEKYLVYRFQPVSKKLHQRPSNSGQSWPTPHILSQLVQQAGGLFMWAKAVMDYIDAGLGGDPMKRLEDVQKTSQLARMQGLDGLYQTILHSIYQNLNEEEVVIIKKVLWTIIMAKEPMDTFVLEELLNVSKGALWWIERTLMPVLAQPSNNYLLQSCHQSFTDFMLIPGRSGELGIDKEQHGLFLANACLDVMNHELKFNILGLKKSIFNKDIENLQKRILDSIPKSLQHACLYWAEYYTGVNVNDETSINCLMEFLQEHLLHWLEALSILTATHRAGPLLRIAEISIQQSPSQISQTLNEGCRLVDLFYLAIGESCTGLYSTILTFCPKECRLAGLYKKKYQHNIQVKEGGLRDWPKNLSILQGHQSSVTSVGFSLDGTKIVSGSWDNTVRLWDACTGQSLGQPLEGHQGGVSSVGFSPDGTKIVSGSSDNTVRLLWDACTGQSLGQPLEGHQNWVTSVGFSPDGTKIVSGSSDNTVRLWDACTGQSLGQPLEGHQSLVSSVGFSPDGTKIVSGSYDNTVRLWDSCTGQSLGQPLEGHQRGVTSVGFSPDGTKIVSGSLDRTVNFWNPNVAAGPLEDDWGGEVRAEMISQRMRQRESRCSRMRLGLKFALRTRDERRRLGRFNGALEISSYSERNNGDPVRTHAIDPTYENPSYPYPLSQVPVTTTLISFSHDAMTSVFCFRHINTPVSVGFSPDGTKIVSGSYDNIVRLWDACTGQSLGQPLEGHQHGVSSVGFSPDETKIVSGSWDNTVRLWDACTGQSLKQPLEGHQDGVSSVGFSPDGTKIVSGSGDNTVRLWDACTGQSLGHPLEGHPAEVTSVVFSPDRTKIVPGSLDRTVKIWNPNVAAGPVVQPGQLFHKTSWRFDIHSGWIYTILLQTDIKVPIAWVPKNLRSGFHTPLTQCVFGAYETVLDFSNYLPWEKWKF
ncbi:hypothetical protein M422DRAFT_192783, partial [Sphaerobolus stellatus SS14]